MYLLIAAICSLAFWLVFPERADAILPIGSDANIEPLANPENPAITYARLAIPILGTILGFIGVGIVFSVAWSNGKLKESNAISAFGWEAISAFLSAAGFVTGIYTVILIVIHWNALEKLGFDPNILLNWWGINGGLYPRLGTRTTKKLTQKVRSCVSLSSL